MSLLVWVDITKPLAGRWVEWAWLEQRKFFSVVGILVVILENSWEKTYVKKYMLK